ncbi:hypothetical protein AX16_008919 [Volvariella volvacea WC 439]|nr:hypothetical protein AX16_008919 [Volvariella volvacea WC 439]
MELNLRTLPYDVNEWDVTRTIASIVHSDEFHPRKPDERVLNFNVKLTYTGHGLRNDGNGVLTFPKPDWGFRFKRWTEKTPLRIAGKRVKVYISEKKPSPSLVERLTKTAYQDPDVLEKHQEIVQKLDEALRVDKVQVGVFYRDFYPTDKGRPLGPRAFSVEWERSFEKTSAAWLRINYEQKRIMILASGSSLTEDYGQEISILFAHVQKIGVGYDPNPYLCFDSMVPPLIEQRDFHASTLERVTKRRLSCLHPGHGQVANYAKDIRVTLRPEPGDVIEHFARLCQFAGLPDSLIVRPRKGMEIDASKRNFYLSKTLYSLEREFQAFTWPVAFQFEALLRSSLVHTEDLQGLLPQVHDLCKQYPEKEGARVADILRSYGEALRTRPPRESPLQCFQRVKRDHVHGSDYLSPGYFLCYHVTFTPTRMLLEGPYPTQSNRVIREYTTVTDVPTSTHPNGQSHRIPEYECNFIRVDFRDEDRLQYRWDKAVDGSTILDVRVLKVLKEGFKLAGREFKFLAYSSSALREHAVWFMRPFQHAQHGFVTPDSIRNSRGDFAKSKDLLKCPSKYAARLALAFTATEPSVKIRRNQWEEVEDLGNKPYLFTDGVGTISQALGDRIWAELCRTRREHGAFSVQPSVYQIRFLGYKGVVAVDRLLDHHPSGVEMRLRPSMKKFESRDVEEADIEIAQAFEHPNPCYLNRPLVMLLEDRGISRDVFLDLQNEAINEARSIDQSTEHFHRVLDSHRLGGPFRLSHILRRLKYDFNLDINPQTAGEQSLDNYFFRQLRQVAVTAVLRDIKHSARIQVPDSYLLVGVVDEGPAYEKMGYTNVYCLPKGQIYACIQQTPDSEPVYLQGFCSISRSPVAHPGDVQRVHAIGRPPADKLCLFAHLKNCVVMASQGDRSLASCLAGGDVDGDLFSIIQYAPLVPPTIVPPALYPPGETLTLDRESNVDDICNFIVDYIKSDVLGLLSDRLLIIADQSKEGMYDSDCKDLAELCSQAVDYPKQGIPVDLSSIKFRPQLIRARPDWHAAEVGPRHYRETDYYISSRALGHLYRAIDIDDVDNNLTQEPGDVPPDVNPISIAIWRKIRPVMDGKVIQSLASEVQNLHMRYVEELRYICITHTVSSDPGSKLQEAEVTLGTILGKCAQARWRKDRMYRLRLHAGTLASQIRRDMLDLMKVTSDVNDDEKNRKILIEGLHMAWAAWRHSVDMERNFGAKTFGLIALSVILDCWDKLGGIRIEEKESYSEGENDRLKEAVISWEG